MIDNLEDRFPKLKAEWQNFASLFKRAEVPAKTILLHEGDTARNFYIIEKGCVRISFNNNGKDVTTQFFFEGHGVASYESFKTGNPSLSSVETIETSILHVITKHDFQAMLNSSPAIKQEFDDYIFGRMVYYQKLFLSRIKDSPQQRYIALLKDNPQIIERVPQHYIASFLGITPVSLSRIRNKVAKG